MTARKHIPVSDTLAPYFFGVDVGGTNIKIGLVDDRGQTLAFDSIATMVEQGPEDACARVAESCREMLAKLGIEPAAVARCGLGTPGPLCLERGMLLNPSNLPSWHGFAARERLQIATGMDVSFINDANAAAFGEFWIGTGADYDGLALLTLGTGVGGGLISEGKLINGKNSFGSELGHMVIDCRPDARLCNWGGGQGQLEAYASASAVALRATEGLEFEPQSALNEVLRTAQELSAKDVYEAAKADDEFAIRIVDETAVYLGAGVASAVHAIDPGIVVLGGAMDFGGDECPVGTRFISRIRKEFGKRTFENVFKGTKIEFATLGGDAGYIGAAGIARQEFHS